MARLVTASSTHHRSSKPQTPVRSSIPDTTVSGASAHNAQTAKSIEEAVAFYDSPAFNGSPAAAAGQIDLTATQIDDIGRFLRAVNAAFNAQLALERLDAARAIVDQFGNDHLATQRKLLRLANEEMQDASKVLGGAPGLNTPSRVALVQARLAAGIAAIVRSPSGAWARSTRRARGSRLPPTSSAATSRSDRRGHRDVLNQGAQAALTILAVAHRRGIERLDAGKAIRPRCTATTMIRGPHRQSRSVRARVARPARRSPWQDHTAPRFRSRRGDDGSA